MTGGGRTRRYRIMVAGDIDDAWAQWLGSGAIEHTLSTGGEAASTFTAFVSDEPGLRGVLTRLWDLNLEILSVVKLPREGGQDHEGTIRVEG